MIDKNKLIGFFGIGIFTYLSITNISYTIGDILKDIFIISNLNHSWTFLASELFRFIFFILLFNCIIARIYNNFKPISEKVMKYFVWSLWAYFISIVIQFLYTTLKSYFEYEFINDDFVNYYNYLKTNYMLHYSRAILILIGEIIAIIIIYKKIKNGKEQFEKH